MPLPSLVPQPRSAVATEGAFVLGRDTTISGPPELTAIARRLLTPGTGCPLPEAGADKAGITITADDTLPDEGYRLSVTPDTITIAAADQRGANWAVHTLHQLLPATTFAPGAISDRFEIPAVTIEDAPRFGWRGVMLDTCRYFYPFADLLGFVDVIAQHKYNVLHLHLTEDQGWRFESKRYPLLQEKATWRTETVYRHGKGGDATPHGGYYTQDQLRALVAYAGERGITIVPEIEFPGHVRAFLAAYPELGNTDVGHTPEQLGTATGWGVFHEVLSVSDPAVEAVFAIFEELLDIFPSTFIHVGGDECPRDEWLASPAARALAAERGLPGPEHLQRWLTERQRDWLAERGRRLVGWDEINDEGPLPGAVVMAWRKARYGVNAAAAGLDVVMAPSSHTYFDHYQAAGAEEPYSIGGLITLEDAYGYEPLQDIPAEQHDHVLGTQCQLWAEYVPTPQKAEYLLWPRACAHSEVAWSDPSDRSFDEFAARLAGHLARLAAQGVNFRPLDGPHPWQQGGMGRWQRPPEHLR